MTIRFSDAFTAAILSDEAALNGLVDCEARFQAGDRCALFEALLICARFQAVMPDWVVDELLEFEVMQEAQEFKDLNEFFGFEKPHAATLRKAADARKVHAEIYAELIRHRQGGGNFSAADGLDNTGYPRRMVEAVYQKEKDNLKRLEKNDSEGYGFMDEEALRLAVSRLRRKGRKILNE